MRLGKYPTALTEGSLARSAYGEPTAHERHRHRYEFNNVYRGQFEAKGLLFSGTSPDGKSQRCVMLSILNDHRHKEPM